MIVELECITRGHKGEVWLLVLKKDRVIVRDADDEVVEEFAAKKARGRFQMPSFFQSIKWFSLFIDGERLEFAVNPEGLRAIRRYVDHAVVTAGPEAVQGVANVAVRDTLLGVGALVGGIVLSLISVLVAANRPEGSQFFFFGGLIVLGLFLVGKGTYGFVKYSNLRRLEDEREREAEET